MDRGRRRGVGHVRVLRGKKAGRARNRNRKRRSIDQALAASWGAYIATPWGVLGGGTLSLKRVFIAEKHRLCKQYWKRMLYCHGVSHSYLSESELF